MLEAKLKWLNDNGFVLSIMETDDLQWNVLLYKIGETEIFIDTDKAPSIEQAVNLAVQFCLDRGIVGK